MQFGLVVFVCLIGYFLAHAFHMGMWGACILTFVLAMVAVVAYGILSGKGSY